MAEKTLRLSLSPEIAYQPAMLHQHLCGLIKVQPNTLNYRIQSRSIDARNSNIKVNLVVDVYVGEELPQLIDINFQYKDVSHRPRVIIVGSGPAGMFAALRLIELGFKPVIVERGQDARARRHDLAAINKKHVVNPESNYCFGEGGAGTYSDGKLYTRSKKRGDINRILQILVKHGANPDILFEAHPHIGTNKLPKLVMELRQTIIDCGGEVHFNAKMTDMGIANNRINYIELENGDRLSGEAYVLATGHSARDVFRFLNDKQILIEAKPFAMGVRVEHPQAWVDENRYHNHDRGDYLPAASYSLVTQTKYEGKQRGMFSFCMCPGGFIVPASTAHGEMVVNGMSPSKRNSKYANSGVVVAVEPEDWKAFEGFGALAALKFQEAFEASVYQNLEAPQAAPAQRLTDFMEGKTSSSLPESSYLPGFTSAALHDLLPKNFVRRMRQGFADFNRKMRGYVSDEAVIVGVESRTSSPVRIPRNKETYQHPQVLNLYPAGEGAGYAGGIMSAAMDGERIAEAISYNLRDNK
jgi:uncharacterized FAD-dependent dehydrogenase